MSKQTFFFYDLETSGLDPREDRIMQFAGQRTSLDLEPIGEPVNLLVKMTDDTLPSPGAIMVTKITPQSTQQDGLTEAELAKYLQEEVFTPNTIAIGYNTVRFDDEFMRHLFWRNFYDPYEWQWKDGRSRWDLLDVVRMTRALRPEGINWPVREDGKPTNRLELITKENGISHEHAHDALSDVTASIDVARLLKTYQPQLFEYLFRMRNKKEVQKLINLEDKKPFVYSSGRYGSDRNFTTVAFPLAPAKNGNVLVYDLKYNWKELFEGKQNLASERDFATCDDRCDKDGLAPHDDGETPIRARKEAKSCFPIVKQLSYNRCPAVAPLSVLDKSNGWQKIGLTKEQIEENLKELIAHSDFADKQRSLYESSPEFPSFIDSESALYGGFLLEQDCRECKNVRMADANHLADLNPNFTDERLPELLLHYKAKNFPISLSEYESKKWEKYRLARLRRQAPKFIKELQDLQQKGADGFILEELSLWYQSLLPSDY